MRIPPRNYPLRGTVPGLAGSALAGKLLHDGRTMVAEMLT
jgi:hypothetical protein